ncbi:cytochrome b5-like heme/steroid binding domain-containing protein SCDLUD_000362 [Saccharomycodes ludwigii]|uniref:cytochrome b5-like heme/steroid binding domain-containing protein n=1 Tax=Saccharomycodes ludwigii TaxID=36035 RepID=UPI001E87D9CB|nr:hypothetical protein SCDLUD_000362 [Saccharomycodes ludwigii]KAH3902773.1 hypothetical protein SCDLUD_000362 [Saccharomycodes ludwigii]
MKQFDINKHGKPNSKLTTPRIIYDKEIQENVKKFNKCWVIIHGNVYDLTNYKTHPGGSSILWKYKGKDCTKKFDEIGHSIESLLYDLPADCFKGISGGSNDGCNDTSNQCAFSNNNANNPTHNSSVLNNNMNISTVSANNVGDSAVNINTFITETNTSHRTNLDTLLFTIYQYYKGIKQYNNPTREYEDSYFGDPDDLTSTSGSINNSRDSSNQSFDLRNNSYNNTSNNNELNSIKLLNHNYKKEQLHDHQILEREQQHFETFKKILLLMVAVVVAGLLLTFIKLHKNRKYSDFMFDHHQDSANNKKKISDNFQVMLSHNYDGTDGKDNYNYIPSWYDGII